MIYVALVVAALVVAIVAELEARGRGLGEWAVILVCLALLYARV